MNKDDFKKALNERVEHINNILYEHLPSKKCSNEKAVFLSKIIESMDYSVKAGGKRLRPIVMLEAYRLCGGSKKFENEIASFLCAIEFIHTYSLVHDDLPAMDNDELRRGLPTTHIKFGEDFGILAGDGLLNYAYEIMSEAVLKGGKNEAKAANIIAQKAGVFGMVGGQALDVNLTGRHMSKDELQFIFEHKTGALLEAAFMAGAYLAGSDDSLVTEMQKAGANIGMAFQIRDDILDETGDEKEIGKPVQSDEKNNKTTYVTFYGMEKAKEDVKSLTDSAVEIIKNTGDNEFLIDLVNSMITRNK